MTRSFPRWMPAPMLAVALLTASPLLEAGATRPGGSRIGTLDLSVPKAARAATAPTPENPRHATEVRSRSPDALLPVATREADPYRSRPLFQHEQRLQLLDTEVPLSLKLGKWKTHDDGKAMGLSATMPLRDPLQ